MSAFTTPHVLRLLVGGAALTLAVSACAEQAELASLDVPVPEAEVATTLPESTTTTVAPPTTTPVTTSPPATTSPPPDVPDLDESPTTTSPPETAPTTPQDPEASTLRPGDDGADVVELQERLVELGYHVPVVDGDYGGITQQAVLAFQKIEGLGRDGVAGPVTLAALETATVPAPREGGDHVEIDLERQVMFVVRGDRTFVFNTSTGAPGMDTPPGRFEVTREIDGMRHAPLGELWRPKYFNGGIALHGSNSIPGHPASHGCARLHNAVIDMIWAEDLVPIGTPVWVY